MRQELKPLSEANSKKHEWLSPEGQTTEQTCQGVAASVVPTSFPFSFPLAVCLEYMYLALALKWYFIDTGVIELGSRDHDLEGRT